jgi:hypothetical protein
MSNRKSPGEELLQHSPYLRKWLSTCGSCGHAGYKPECPDTGPVYWELKRCFPLLELNRVGLCNTCAHVTQPPGQFEFAEERDES